MNCCSFIHTADWHLHRFRSCSKNNGLDRLNDGLSVVEQIFDYASEYECPIVVAGDLKQQKGTWDQLALSGLIDICERHSHVQVLALSGNGNHDGTGKETTGESALAPLRLHMRCHSEPFVGRLDIFDEMPIALWPWQPTLEALPQFLRDAEFHGARILFGHGMFEGSAVGPIEYRPSGAPLKLSDFGLSGPPKNRKFDAAFFGDVHKKQKLGGVYYCGSPYAQNWGEREIDKGVYFVEIDWNAEKGRIDSIKATELRIKAPRYRVIDLSKRLPSKVPWGKFKDDFVRVLVPVGMSLNTEQVQEETKARWLEFRPIRKVQKIERKEEINAAMSPVDIIEGYVRAVPPGEEFSARDVAKLGLKLWKEGGAK